MSMIKDEWSKWSTFLGMLLLAGWRYLLVGVLILTLGYVGVESWLYVKQSPPTKAVEQAVEPLVKSYRTDKHEAELVFYRMKDKITALEKEVAALKLERQTRIAQLQSYEQARLRVQDNPPWIVDLDSHDLQRKAKELLGVQVEVK